MRNLMFSFFLAVVIAVSKGMPKEIDEFFSLGDWFPHSDPYQPKTMSDMVLPYHYPLEEHEVVTEDGYILTMYRIPYGVKSEPGKRPALFLQHGIMCSSACWTLSDPSEGLAFILADAGYDVWMGNSRGTTYSRKHKTLDPDKDKQKFWNFSFHEMGYYDLPASIDFILNKTQQSQVYYVGHSQGTTMFFAMAASRPEYNAKIKVMSALAPIAFLDHTRGAIRAVTKFTSVLESTCSLFNIYEILPNSFFLRMFDTTVCKLTAITRPICDNLLFMIAGYDSQQLNVTLIPAIADVCPSGASVKQLIHFGQLANNGEQFRMYDYGSDNQKHYGQSQPPDYKLNQITAPVMLHYADNDRLAGTQDVEKLYEHLPNATKFEVPFAYFNHLDFMWAIDVNPLLYDTVIDAMKKFE